MVSNLSPSQAVLEFLAAYRDWEVEANSNWEGASDDGKEAALAAINEQYAALLAQFVTPRVLARARGAAFADPPSMDPSRVEIAEESRSGNRAIVRTLETFDPDEDDKDEFEYELLEDGDLWRIDDRRTRDLDGRWIHLVL